MGALSKNIIVIIFLVFSLMFLYRSLSPTESNSTYAYSEFLTQVERLNVAEVVINGERAYFQLNANQQNFSTIIPQDSSELVKLLDAAGVKYKVKPTDNDNIFLRILVQWLPVLLIIGIWIFIFRSFQGGGKIMSFNKINQRKKNIEKPNITFKDVAGIEEAKEEVSEIVDYIKNTSKFQKLGGKIPTGVLFAGQPGTGKTLLAKAIAGEAGVSFFNMSGSDFVEMFVGVGASRVRDLFEQARANSPCIVFIDEIDAVGRNRGSGMGGGNDEREQTLNQLLVEMDGFKGHEGIIIIAATNRPDVLDPALVRPGRFDRTIIIPPPDVKGREAILKIHSKDVKLSKSIDLESIAKSTPGSTGADLANLVNEAALSGARKKKKTIDNSDFEEARDKIFMGRERKSLIMKDKEKKTTAYHEAGHAIIARLCKHVDRVHKVTIVPRGRALGVTMLLPDTEKRSYSESKLKDMLKMMMGGRAAEELIFNHYTTGASNDLERATHIAHDMVCKWGMSKLVGPLYYSGDDSEVFLGRDMMKRSRVSQHAAQIIDKEVKKIVNNAYTYAVKMLKNNLDALHKVSAALIKQETIDGKEIDLILKETGAI